MSIFAALAPALGSLVGGIFGGNKQGSAADAAARMQAQAAQQGIAENARQFDVTQQNYQPYLDAGYAGLDGYSALMGMGGAEAQQSEIDMLRESPLFKSLYGQGQDAILASASATGGLRGGNTQGALYGMGEDTLSRVIQQQLSGYAGMAGMGTGATGALAGFGAQSVGASNNLRQQGADAGAQAQLLRGGMSGQNWNNFGNVLGQVPWDKIF